jgi:DNA topoisomerase-1
MSESKILVIVESPKKCKQIENYLGPNYKVIASYGHLREMNGLSSIDVTNNFSINYSNKNESQIEKIRKEIKKSKEVILATDIDREGESIAWHICDLFGLDITNTKRLIFNEITEPAIKKAIEFPQNINMNIVYSQQSRQILDLLVGFTISPVLWKCISKSQDNSLSAGRCQTPALRLIYDNYLDIKTSTGKKIYNTIGYFTNLNLPFELNTQFNNENDVRTFLNHCININGNNIWNFSLEAPKKTIKKSPEPLTTSSLQQLASNELHMSPKETMKYAQELYEGGYITYMRTDAKKYSDVFIEDVKKYIKNTYGDAYVKNIETLQKETQIQTQDAHESIRPVHIELCPNASSIQSLSSKVIKLYGLIWKRTLSSCMPSAQYNSICAKINAPLDTYFIYKTEIPIFLGWQVVENITVNNNYQYISTLKQNISLMPKKIESKFNFIEIKSHYSEAKLVQLLEEQGIGRPSTFASIVDKIQEREYVKKENIDGVTIEGINFKINDGEIIEVVEKKVFGNEKNKLVIQPLGIIVIEFLINKFDTFFNYNYTKEMETNLDKIAKGNLQLVDLCDVCYKDLTNVLKDNSNKKINFKIDENHSLIVGKYGPVIKCIRSKSVYFLPVRKDFDLTLLTQTNSNNIITLEDIIDKDHDNKEDSKDECKDDCKDDCKNGHECKNVHDCKNAYSKLIGKYKGKDLFIKNGKYGMYAQWGDEKKTLKDEFNFENIETQYIDVLKFLDKDILDPNKPVGFIRELNNHLSIRHGKYGDYIFNKKAKSKVGKFLKLTGFVGDYTKCDKSVLLEWIKNAHKI